MQQVDSIGYYPQMFSGAPESDVEAFINAVTIYKDCANVSDQKAKSGIAFLLTTWWNCIKNQITSSDDAVIRLRKRNRRTKLIKTYLVKNKIDIFVCQIRALFAQLP